MKAIPKAINGEPLIVGKVYKTRCGQGAVIRFFDKGSVRLFTCNEINPMMFTTDYSGCNAEGDAALDIMSSWVEAVPAPVDIGDTLKERGERYGDFRLHANISQSLKTNMKATDGWDRLTHSQKESLEMIVHKIARILNGDPNYHDSWRDIAGYATLVADKLKVENQ